MSYDSILIPTDGSAAAERATDHALSLADTFDADVHALGVLDLQQAAGPFDAGGLGRELLDRLQREAEENVEHVTTQWARPDSSRETVEEGVPSRTILEYIDEHDIDLVVMGKHGRTGLRRFVLGSVTEHVLRESPVPVLATHATEEPPTLPYRNVLVPTDGSDCASGAVDHAIPIAKATGATLHALSVVDDAAILASPGGALPAGYLEGLESMGEETTAALAERAESADIDVETAVERGRPGDGIEDYAESHGVDLVVMGTHGRSGMERFLLGSTTEQVIRSGSVPVLAVPDVATDDANGTESTDDGSDVEATDTEATDTAATDDEATDE
jgi:nucleotide-binding universal stress UspA family protein